MEKIAFEKHIMQEKFNLESSLTVAMHAEKMKLIKAKRIYFETISNKLNITLDKTS